jgi:hypothetical protein
MLATSAQHDLAAAIPRRRTDRRRFSPWPVPAELIGEMLELAHVDGVGLEAITEPALRWKCSGPSPPPHNSKRRTRPTPPRSPRGAAAAPSPTTAFRPPVRRRRNTPPAKCRYATTPGRT